MTLSSYSRVVSSLLVKRRISTLFETGIGASDTKSDEAMDGNYQCENNNHPSTYLQCHQPLQLLFQR